MPLLFIWAFLFLLIAAVPVAFTMGISAMLGLFVNEGARFLIVVPQRIFAGIDKFPLIAVPLFILAGELMNGSGITQRLVAFSSLIVGRLRGGLAQVNIFSSIIFAGISGSAVADTAALGSMLIPSMEKDGYKRSFAAAVTAASSIIGPIIPPSIIMVIYAYVMQVPTGALFLAGIVPGVMMGVAMMIMTYFLVGPEHKESELAIEARANAGRVVVEAILPAITPVIIVGGIVGGVFTPTESAAAAVAYTSFIALFVLRTTRFTELPDILFRAAKTSGTILFMIGAAALFAWLATIAGIPQLLTTYIIGLTANVLLLFFLINIFLLLIGMVLDAAPAILILGPIFAPIMTKLGVDPIHFAVVMCVNLTIGLATPPVGMVLFVASSVARERIEAISKKLLPYLGTHLIVLFLITYFPILTMWIPEFFGY